MTLNIIELNEISISFLRKYIEKYPDKFTNLEKVLSSKHYKINLTKDYKLLEPWIQWSNLHYDLPETEHKIFKLDDPAVADLTDVFEAGQKSYGSIGIMNLKRGSADYFISDAWSQHESVGFWGSQTAVSHLKRLILNNKKLTLSVPVVVALAYLSVRFISISDWPNYLALIFKSIKKPWFRPLVLDRLLFGMHLSLSSKYKVDVALVFLNGAAHNQHHLFFNSEFVDAVDKNPSWYFSGASDPIFDTFLFYERLLTSISNEKYIIGNGLDQELYDRTKFYYRLSNPRSFFSNFPLPSHHCKMRMSRDLTLVFQNTIDAREAKIIVEKIFVNQSPIFGDIYTQSNELNLTLKFHEEIQDTHVIALPEKTISLKDHVEFIALKNSMHCNSASFFTNVDEEEDIPFIPALKLASNYVPTIDSNSEQK